MKITLRFPRFIRRAAAIASLVAITTFGQTPSTSGDSHLMASSAASYDELKDLLKNRYDGKVVVAEVSGLFAGEQKKLLFGPGENGVYWSHFASGAQLPSKRASDLHQLDDNTFGLLHAGLNVTQIEKGERLKVYKFYVTSDFVQLVLTPTSLEHMRDLDMSRASKETTTTTSGHNRVQNVSVAGFGLVFSFHFKKGAIKDDHDYAAIVQEINKYLLPESEAKEVAAAKQNVEIEPGMTEDQVIKALGQPLQTVKFGEQKTLKYKGMTVILKDGKVTDLKVE